jgi:hypothetical protein
MALQAKVYSENVVEISEEIQIPQLNLPIGI